MPELVEVERYRALAERMIGWRITAVEVLDPRMLRGHVTPPDLAGALSGRPVTAARRIGKLLLLDTGGRRRSPVAGPTLGMRFGMTGTLMVAGVPGVDRLLYGSNQVDERWIRFRMRLKGRLGGVGSVAAIELHDPRRLGSVELDPDEARLGPDAASLSLAGLRQALGGRDVVGGPSGPALKARILDQSRIAGVGNLIADEVLWRADLSPLRPAAGLSDPEIRRLCRRLVSTVAVLSARGGSHTGDLGPHRHAGGHCPRDGATLRRDVVGGRTTWWCPAHQR